MTYNQRVYIVTKEVHGASRHSDLSILSIHSHKELAWLDIQEDVEAVFDDAGFIAHFIKSPFKNAPYNGLEITGYCPKSNQYRSYRYIRYRIFAEVVDDFM